MFEDDLRKFHKEVLVQFIFADSVFSRERTMEQLRHYEKRFRFRKLSERRDAVVEKMQRCANSEGCAELKEIVQNELVQKNRKIQHEMHKILGIEQK